MCGGMWWASIRRRRRNMRALLVVLLLIVCLAYARKRRECQALGALLAHVIATDMRRHRGAARRGVALPKGWVGRVGVAA